MIFHNNTIACILQLNKRNIKIFLQFQGLVNKNKKHILSFKVTFNYK